MEWGFVVNLQFDIDSTGLRAGPETRRNHPIGKAVRLGDIALQGSDIDRLPRDQRRDIPADALLGMMLRIDNPHFSERNLMNSELDDPLSEALAGLNRNFDLDRFKAFRCIGCLKRLLCGHDIRLGAVRPQERIDDPLDVGVGKLRRPHDVDRGDQKASRSPHGLRIRGGGLGGTLIALREGAGGP